MAEVRRSAEGHLLYGEGCPECGRTIWRKQRAYGRRCRACGRRAATATMMARGHPRGMRGKTHTAATREKLALQARDNLLDHWGRERSRTRESVIRDIQKWARLHGEPPRSTDWGRRKRRNRAQPGRFGSLDTRSWPVQKTVLNLFGSWNAAIEAAGFAPRPRGYDPASSRARKAKQRCKRGHRLAGDNLITDKRGYRHCKRCQRQRQRERRAAARGPLWRDGRGRNQNSHRSKSTAASRAAWEARTEIASALGRGDSGRKIAARFGVSHTTVQRIAKAVQTTA